jgi:hypothetical protein
MRRQVYDEGFADDRETRDVCVSLPVMSRPIRRGIPNVAKNEMATRSGTTLLIAERRPLNPDE